MYSKAKNGGMETIIAMVIVLGLIAALLVTVVLPMSQEGDSLINTTTNQLIDQQSTIGPQ